MDSGGTTYQFDPIAASAFFDNVFTGLGVVDCTDAVLSCLPGNTPATPASPPPDPAETEAFAITLSDIFFSGGILGSTTYQQIVGATGIDGSGTFMFHFGYSIDPNVNPVAALTAWTPISTVPLPATLPLFASGLAGLGWLSRRRRQLS